MQEEWRSVKDWESYEVSNTGRVRNIHPRSRFSDGILKPILLLSTGYMKVTLCNGPHLRKDLLIHRLVAIAFHGDPPTIKHEVNHKDGVKTHNKSSNLEWTTKAGNAAHAVAMNLKFIPPIHAIASLARGERSGRAKLNNSSVSTIRASRLSRKALAKKFDVSLNTIARVQLHQTWK